MANRKFIWLGVAFMVSLVMFFVSRGFEGGETTLVTVTDETFITSDTARQSAARTQSPAAVPVAEAPLPVEATTEVDQAVNSAGEVRASEAREADSEAFAAGGGSLAADMAAVTMEEREDSEDEQGQAVNVVASMAHANLDPFITAPEDFEFTRPNSNDAVLETSDRMLPFPRMRNYDDVAEFNKRIATNMGRLWRLERLGKEGPRCLDGSQPAVYMHENMWARNWVLHIEGRDFCADDATCLELVKSSNDSAGGAGQWKAGRTFPYSGVLANDNPFFAWNKALLLDCDGSGFMSNLHQDKPRGKYYQSGFQILKNSIVKLKRRSTINQALEIAIVARGMAAIGVLSLAGWIKAQFASQKRVLFVVEDGVITDLDSVNFNIPKWKQTLESWGSRSIFNETCIQKYKNDYYKCTMFPYLMEFVPSNSPVLVVQNAWHTRAAPLYHRQNPATQEAIGRAIREGNPSSWYIVSQCNGPLDHTALIRHDFATIMYHSECWTRFIHNISFCDVVDRWWKSKFGSVFRLQEGFQATCS